MAITISVLDQSPIYPGETASEALAHTIELAQRAEEFGYHRFWVSEHHDSANVAGSSPEVLVSYLLAKTKSIRVGSGGVMLQHYSPYKVAENFNLLAALAPGRVDLGIGRAPGGLPRSTRALQQGVSNAPSLTDKLFELDAYVNSRIPADHPLSGITTSPIPPVPPVIYLLGASADSAKLAAELGLPYVFSLSISGDRAAAVEAIHTYRSSFRTDTGRAPQAIVALAALVADTDEEAHELAGDHKNYKIYLADGRKLTVGTLEQAEEFGRQSGEPYTIEERQTEIVKGSKESVRRELLSLQRQTGVEEFIVTTRIPDYGKRLRSFELLREALDGALAGV